MLNSLTTVPLATEQDGVRASRRTECELVQGKNLTARLQDALLGGDGEAEGRNGELGNLKQTDVIRNGADDDDDLGVTVGRARRLLQDTGQGDGGTVGLGEEKTVEDRLYEDVLTSNYSRPLMYSIDLVES